MPDIFNLTGPEFLQFYLALMAGGLAVALCVRFFLRFPDGMTVGMPALDTYDLAFLSGRLDGLVTVTVAKLLHRGVLKADPVTCAVEATGDHLHDGDEMEACLLQAAGNGLARLPFLNDAIAAQAVPIERKLIEWGLVLPGSQRRLATFAPIAVMGVVLIVGLIKMLVGIERDRPIGFLAILCIVAAGVTFLVFRQPAWRSHRGNRVLAKYRRENPALRTSAMFHGEQLSPNDVALAMALFGGVVAAGIGGEVARYYQALHPPRQSIDWGRFLSGDSSCSVASSCGGGGSSCGGGGGGGGCGGGGGGCGGCGGGG